MYRKEIILDDKSYVETSSRILENEEGLALTLRGPKGQNETALASVILDLDETRELVTNLLGWIKTQER